MLSCFVHRPAFLLAVWLVILTVEIPAFVIQQSKTGYDAPNASAVFARPSEQFLSRNSRAYVATTTLTVASITTISATTTTITTRRTCANLGFATGTAAATTAVFSPGAITTFSVAPSVTCRRKRQYWRDPVYAVLQNEDDLTFQHYRLSPSEMIHFQPTLLPAFRYGQYQPQFRNNYNQKEKFTDLPATSDIIQPSFEKETLTVRLADPIFFGNALSSLVSSLVGSVLTSTTFVTTTSTTFSSTVTSSVFTATSTYYIVGPCYPAGVTTCP